MSPKRKFLNYLGQIRVYSIVDLILLLFAINTGLKEFFGFLFLHLGFVLYLEFRHKHSYRRRFPSWLWVVFLVIGILLFYKFVVIGFLFASFFYAEKKNNFFGTFSSLFRGLQYYFLVSGLMGFSNSISFFVGGLILLRNLAGDFRDITKDKKEGSRTLPIFFGFNNDIKYIYPIFLLITSFVWWYLSNLNIVWLLAAYVVETVAYNLTPR